MSNLLSDLITSKEYIKQQLIYVKGSNLFVNMDDTIIDYLTHRLWISINPYLNLELLYPLDLAEKIFNGLLNEEVVNFSLKAAAEKLLIDKKNYDYDTVGQITNNSKQSVGYSGFSVINQEGAFNNASADNTTTGANRIEYIAALSNIYNNWIRDFLRLVLTHLLRQIY